MKPTLTIAISTRSVIIALSLTLAVVGLIWLSEVLVVMALAFMIAGALGPVVRYFQDRIHMPRAAAVVTTFLLLLGVLFLFGLIVIPTLVDQARTLATAAPAYSNKLRGSYAWLRVFDTRFAWLPDPNVLAAGVHARITGWAESGLGLAGKVFGAMFGLFIVLISAFYILIDADKLQAGFLRMLPAEYRESLGAQLEPAGHKIGAYVRGVFTSITILVTYLAIALTIAGEPLSLVLALMAGCFEIIPTLGPVLGAIPAILIGLTVSWKLAVVVFGIFACGVFFQSNFIAPMLYSREVDVPPLLITVALLIGGELMGVLGAMVAVPVLAVSLVLIENLYIQPRELGLRKRTAVTLNLLEEHTIPDPPPLPTPH